jgi:hypothetical protein
MPHMHARGKDMTYSLEHPDGGKQVILSVPRYDFNWQLGYNVSIKVPERHDTPRRRALRQLNEQPIESGSKQDGLLRSMTWEEG